MLRLASLLALAPLAAAAAAPEQIWITRTGKPGEMAVSWVTVGAGAAPEGVIFGASPSALDESATATSEVFSEGMAVPIRIHVATLTGLPDNATQVYYEVGGGSTVYNFTAAPARPGGTVYAIFGDLGLADDYSLDSLLAEAAADAFDAVIFAGDFAYDLETSSGEVGNEFLIGLEPIIATHPLLPVAGNHEAYADNSFAHYKARFAAARALGKNSGNAGADANRWYSFDDGLVHWICLDTEIYSYGTAAQIAAQKAWLAADIAAIDRSRTPWVLAQAHKGYWEAPKTDWASLGFDQSFASANIDAVFVGHTHNYQRSLAFAHEKVADKRCYAAGPPAVYSSCAGTIGILAGSPGMSQGLGTRLLPDDIAALDLQAWGYGKLTVANATHLRWQWFEVATKEGAVPWGLSAVNDEAWIVRGASFFKA